MERMKAVVCEKYGGPEVLEIKEVNKQVPQNNQLLIRVHATSANAADCNTRGFTYIPNGLGFLGRLMLGIFKPRINILGSVFAGEVEAVGRDIKLFKVGDRVFGTSAELGAYAEYLCRSEEGAIAIISKDLSFEEAATIPYGALTALYFLKDKAKIKDGQKILVKGASGGVGVFAVQIANYFGAEVTGICSTSNLEIVKLLGAVKVIDYTKEEYSKSGEKYDIIFDVVVGKTSFSRNKNILNPNGYYLAVAGGLADMIQMLWTSIRGGKKVIVGGGSACETKENMEFLSELLEKENIKPIIDSTYTLDQIVDAHRYVEQDNKKGSVAIKGFLILNVITYSFFTY